MDSCGHRSKQYVFNCLFSLFFVLPLHAHCIPPVYSHPLVAFLIHSLVSQKKKKKKNLVTSFICLTCISFAHWWHVYILKQSGGEEDREPEPEPEREYTPAGRALKAKL